MIGPDSPKSAFRRAAEAWSFEQTQDASEYLRKLERKSAELRALRAAIHAVCMDDMYEDFVCRVLRDAKAAIEKRAAEILDGANARIEPGRCE